MRDSARDSEALPALVAATAWPDTSLSDLRIKKISHRRNADHFRVVRADGPSVVVRITDREPSALRIVGALEALEGETLAPKLYRWRHHGSKYFIVMEDLGDLAPTAHEVQARIVEFIEVLRRLHAHHSFREAIERVGRAVGEDSSVEWAEQSWQRLQQHAPTDPRVMRALPWIERVREESSHHRQAEQIFVYGHGDAHTANWRLTPSGLVLIDWEEIRRWPLASELADFIVFGDLDPAQVTGAYGVPGSYAQAVHREAAACALSFYLDWLRALIDGSDPRAIGWTHVAQICERLFAS